MDRWRALLPGLWLGFLLCVAGLAAPHLFAMLAPAQAGQIAARMLAQEAYTSLAFGALLIGLERTNARRRAVAGQGSQFSAGMALAAGTLFCTVAGYFVVQPMMGPARAGQGPVGFATLHMVSVGFYVVKCGLVAALAWRATAKLSRTAAS